MPLYDFQCHTCGPFTLQRSIDDRDHPVLCNGCGRKASRSVSAPMLSLMSGIRRDAHVRNERSQHEPGVSNRHTCGSGCGCGPPRKGRAPKTAAQVNAGKLGRLNASRTSKRPWMLGH
jgi:putative FmdB family regulatory protein